MFHQLEENSRYFDLKVNEVTTKCMDKVGEERGNRTNLRIKCTEQKEYFNVILVKIKRYLPVFRAVFSKNKF